MSEAIPARVRAIVLARAGDACEVCGADGRMELHHRVYRSRGGKHHAANLVALCGWGNHTGHHGWAHTDAQAALWGASLHSWQDPYTERFWSALRGVWVLLDDLGNATEVA